MPEFYLLNVVTPTVSSILWDSNFQKGVLRFKKKKKEILLNISASWNHGKSEVLDYLLEDNLGVPFVAQWLTNPTSIHEDVGLILGLTLWVGDPVLRELWPYITEVAPISLCYSSGWQLQLPLDPLAWNLHMPRVWP